MNPSSRFVTIALLLVLAAPAPAQETYPALGLSSSPDAYVDEITVPFGADFTLYVFLSGPAGGILPFDLRALDWALLGSCCGGSPAIYTTIRYLETMEHSGDPALVVSSSTTDCVDRDFLVLAEVNFNWLYEPNSEFHLGVVSLSAALDCSDAPWILTGLPILVIPTGITPAEASTWSDLKALYR